MNLKIYEKTKYNNIYKHKENGTYAVDLSLGYDLSGKRIRTTKTGILSEKEAKKILSNEESKRNLKNKIINISKFDDCIEEYYEWCTLSKKVSDESLRKKKCRFNKHIIPFFKGMDLVKIDENVILRWHQKLDNTSTLNATSKNTMHKQLSAYFNWLLLHKKVITFNPCLTVDNFKLPQKKIEYRTLEQMNLLWKTILNDEEKDMQVKLITYALTKVLFFTGFRIGELLGTKLKDYDYDIINNDEITVDQIKLNLDRTIYYGKSGWILRNGKTDSSLGTVYIGKHVFQPIFDYIKYMQKNGYIFGKEDYIFTNVNSNKDIPVYSTSYFRDNINYFTKKAKLPYTKPKDMRSSSGTLLLSNGYSLEEVQSHLRHSRKETTQKFYATFYEQNKINIANGLDKLAQ